MPNPRDNHRPPQEEPDDVPEPFIEPYPPASFALVWVAILLFCLLVWAIFFRGAEWLYHLVTEFLADTNDRRPL